MKQCAPFAIGLARRHASSVQDQVRIAVNGIFINADRRCLPAGTQLSRVNLRSCSVMSGLY